MKAHIVISAHDNKTFKPTGHVHTIKATDSRLEVTTTSGMEPFLVVCDGDKTVVTTIGGKQHKLPEKPYATAMADLLYTVVVDIMRMTAMTGNIPVTVEWSVEP